MNKTIMYFFLNILINFSLFCQEKNYNGEVTYEAKIIVGESLKKIENTNVSEEVKSAVIGTMKNQDRVYYKLLYNNNESLFKKNEKLEVERGKNELIKILVGKGIFYTNKKSKKILNQKEAFGELFLIEEPQIKWTLTQERKKIGEYICYKATTIKKIESRRGKSIKKVTAWYAPKIPINFGPKNYCGLPGLIIKLQEGNLLFKVSKINLLPNKKIEIKEPGKGKKVTLKKYNEIVKKIIKSHWRNK